MSSKLSDNVAFALGIVIGITFLGAGLALGAADRAFDWITSRFAVPPRESWKKNDNDSE
jgi:hypothetical protein